MSPIDGFYSFDMELGQNEAFLEAQRRGSNTRAAAALELTQPTLTARLRGLEQELGAQLLVRGRRGVSLTAAGRRFLPRAQAALEAVRRGGGRNKGPPRRARGPRPARPPPPPSPLPPPARPPPPPP